ncbi:MAG: UDP-N-acetylmuramate--L-alanine ligase [Candidatus Omnitrophica bacterium]|nr:UDP-N-acetylmuramate--L-alanine ligase [Candidatus Omnitrophota bacterium]
MKIHFIGIGGIGMSGLAKLALSDGHCVSGSDLYLNNLTDDLSSMGATVFEGHGSDNLPQYTDLVVYSSCITDKNPEREKAFNLKIDLVPRTMYLKDRISFFPESIGVIGTHGKTTTTSLIAHIFEFAGFKPTIFIGGELPSIGSNAKKGTSHFFITEVDESDGLFRNLSLKTAVLNNIEREHVENFRSFENVIDSYGQFISNVPKDGLIVYNKDDSLLESLVSSRGEARKIGYTLKGTTFADYYCDNFTYKNKISFDIIKAGELLGTVKADLFGKHNAYNIFAAVIVALENNIKISVINETLKTFRLPKRRFEFVGEKKGIKIYEDYAHHPTEIRSILEAVKENTLTGRVIAVFQPHRYSRTIDLLDQFADCFISADILILTDIYSAFENTAQKVGIEHIYSKISSEQKDKVKMIKLFDIPEHLKDIAKKEDIILVIGAGDVNKISKKILETI